MDDSEARKRKAMEVPFTSSGVLTTDSDHQDTAVQSGFLSSSTIKKEKYSDLFLDKENIDPGKDRSSKRYRSVSELRAKLQSCVVNSDAKQSSTANPRQRSRAMPLSSLKQIIDGKWSKATSKFFPEGPLQTALPIRRLKLQPGLVEDKECNNVPKAICRNSKSPANEDLSALNYKGQGIELHRNRGHSFDDETLGSKDEICQIVSSNMSIDIEMTAALLGANEKARPAVEAVSMAPSQDLPCSLDYLTSDGSICLEDEVKSVISLSGPVTHSDTPTAFQCQNAKLNVKSNRSQSFDEEALGSKDGNCQLENLNMWSDVEMEVALSGATEKPRLIVEAASMTPSQDSQTPLDFLTIGGSSCLEDEAKSVISLSATTAFQCQNAKWNLKSNRSHFLDDEALDSKDGNCQVKNSNMRPSPEMETALSEATENPVPVVETVSRAPSEDLETPLNSVTVGGFICLEDEAKCVISLSGPVRHSDVPTAFQCQNAKSNVKSYRSHFLDDESIGSKNGNHQVESSNMCSSTKMRTALSGATEQPVPVVEAVLRAPSQDVQTPFDSNTVGGSICLEDEAKCLISISGPVGHSDAPTAFQCQNKKLNVKSEAPSHGDTSSDNCRNATSTMIYLQSPVDRSYGPKAASGSICLEDEFRCVGSLSGHRAHSDAPNIANSNFMYYQVASHSNAMKLSSEKSRGLRSSELNSQAPSMLDSLPESIMPKAATDSLCLEDEGRCILSLSGPTDAPTVSLSQNANIDVKDFQIPSHSKRFKSPIKNPSFLPSSEVNNSVVSSMVLQEKSLPKIVGERALSEACSSADGRFSKNGGHLDVKKDKKHCLADDRSRQHKKRWESEQFFWVNGKRYQRLGKIGKGGSSEVYKVIASDCTIYALKRIRLKGRDYCSAYGFYQEIEYLEKLRGKKYIIQLIDYEVTKKGFFQHQASKVGTIEDDVFIYMVLECGDIDLAHMLLEEWNERMSNGREMDENWLRYFWKQMLEAVNTIHELRIVHSDLKPANFLLVKGVLKLIDFGIAKAIQSDTTNILRESQVGTVNYMSPESFMMNEDDEYGQVFKCGRPSDIWSLGCILYQMVYGKTPFSHITKIWAKVKEITNPNHEIPFPPVANPQLIDVLKGCLAWKREDRLRIPELLQHPFLLCNPRSLPIHKKKQVEAAVPEVA